MKIVNIVLCSLILVLALVSAVFSFFLFEKRTALVEGWDKMSGTINTASSNMDKTSGTTHSQKLTKETLSHQKYTASDLTAKTNEFIQQNLKVVKQRDSLAEAMQRIGETTRMRTPPTAENFRTFDPAADEDTEESDRKRVVNSVERVVKNMDAAIRAREKAETDRRYIKSKIDEIGKIVNRSGSESEIVNAVAKCKQDLNRATREVSRLERERDTMMRERDDCKNRLNRTEREKAALQRDLAQVREDYKRLTTTAHGDIVLWKDGSDEVRSHVVGEVIEVNKDRGYIVFDLNTEQRITQKVGTKELKVDPMLAPGLEMVVCRGDVNGSSAPTFVTKIKIENIDATCGIANIPAGKNIRVGDKVINNTLYEKSSKKDK